MPLINWIKNNNISTPVKLEIGLDKLICHYPETRYFTIKINGHTVTQMVANALGRKISKYGSIIIHGGGMDMGAGPEGGAEETPELAGGELPQATPPDFTA